MKDQEPLGEKKVNMCNFIVNNLKEYCDHAVTRVCKMP